MFRKKSNNLWTILLLVLIAFPMDMFQALANPSLSDLSLETFENEKNLSGERNPFSPGSQGSSDPSSLSLEGIIIGPQTKLALVTGRILREGQASGGFILNKVSPGSINIKSLSGETVLPLDGYVYRGEENLTHYEIMFQNALLKDALRMIATAGKFNVIIPEDVTGRVTLIFHDTPIKNALGSMLRVNGLEYAEESGIVRVGKPASFASGAFFETKQISLRYATAPTLLTTIKSHLSKEGTVTADERTNTIIIKDSQSVMDNLLAMVEDLDRKEPSVHIEGKIVDVTRNFSRALGIQWGFTKDGGRVTGFGGPSVGNIPGSGNPTNINLPAASPTSGFGILIGNLINQTDLEAQISAAEGRGEAHIISQPSVTTLNNTPAKIRSGLKFYVKNSSTIAVGGSGSAASGSESDLEEIDTGIELTVTPQITSEDTIKLTIEAEESEADFSRTVDGIPAVIDNVASTTVLVRDGETTVIGGLMKVKKSDQSNGVPFIASVPILGWFFKNKSRATTDNELLLFITPKIVDNAMIYQPRVSQIGQTAEIEQPKKTETKTTRKSMHRLHQKRRGNIQ